MSFVLRVVLLADVLYGKQKWHVNYRLIISHKLMFLQKTLALSLRGVLVLNGTGHSLDLCGIFYISIQKLSRSRS